MLKVTLLGFVQIGTSALFWMDQPWELKGCPVVMLFVVGKYNLRCRSCYKEWKPDFSLICQDSWIKIYSLPPNAHMHGHIWSCLAHSCSGSCLSSCPYIQWHNHLIYFSQLNPKATDRFLLRVSVMPKATISLKWSWSQNLLLCFFVWIFFLCFIGIAWQCIMIKISLTI